MTVFLRDEEKGYTAGDISLFLFHGDCYRLSIHFFPFLVYDHATKAMLTIDVTKKIKLNVFMIFLF